LRGLGFDLIEDIDQNTKRRITVQPPADGPLVVLARADTPGKIARVENQAGGRVWLFPHWGDFARDAARIIAAGGVSEEPPRQAPFGIVAFWQDPFGNRSDLVPPS